MLVTNIYDPMSIYCSKWLREAANKITEQISREDRRRHGIEMIEVVPHHGSIYEIFCNYEHRCDYVQDLLDLIGADRFVQTRYGLFARDDEVLAQWTLAYDADEELESAWEFWEMLN